MGPTVDQIRDVVRAVCGTRQVNTNKIAEAILSMTKRELTFEEFQSDSNELEGLTLDEHAVLLECMELVLAAVRKSYAQRDRQRNS